MLKALERVVSRSLLSRKPTTFDVTLCLTAGGRPDLLERTLKSLLPYNREFFAAVLVTNDRGDEASNVIIRRFLPEATLLLHETAIGEFACVDEMCAMATTSLIFHCEDDWEFDPVPFIPMMVAAIRRLPTASTISARQSGSLRAHYNRDRHWQRPVPIEGSWAVRQLDESEEWKGLSFNPALFRKSFWQRVGPYGRLKTEKAINDAVEAAGYRRAFLVPGIYEHTGDGRHIDNPA